MQKSTLAVVNVEPSDCEMRSIVGSAARESNVEAHVPSIGWYEVLGSDFAPPSSSQWHVVPGGRSKEKSMLVPI